MNLFDPDDSDTIKLPRWAEALVVLMIITILILLLYPAVQQARETAKLKSPSRRHLKYLGLAIHNFDYDHTKNSSWDYPTDASGAPLHSWMTDLLPYIDEAAMAQQIDHAKSWDSPENETVFTIPVLEFTNPSLSNAPHQNAAGYGLAHYSANSRLVPFNANRNLTTVENSDGLSNTLLVGEINSSFPAWGDPANLRDPARGLQGGPDANGGTKGEGVYFLFADGRARFLNKDIDPHVLKALSTPDGGEIIPHQESN